MRVSKRSDVAPFLVMDMIEAARKREAAGRRVVHMEVGQPGTPAPLAARRALAQAMERGALGYTVSLGLPELRHGIADLYRRRHGIDLDPARVVVTAGSSGAFLVAFSMLFDPGDRVALGAPGYPSYRQILKSQGIVAVDIETRMEDRFQPVPDSLPDDIAGLIVASPSNPAGTMLDKPSFAALIEAARERDAVVVSDEIYHGLEYDRPAISALKITDDVIVVNSFSKYWSMTGWRIGWMVVPEDMIRAAERLQQNMFICAPHASQVAAIAALEAEEEAQANLAVYATNRSLMLEGLPKAGITAFAPPDGAFYVYADVSMLTDDSQALAMRLLEEAGVATTTGLDFDTARGAGTLRFSYAASTADIEEGLARLRAFGEAEGWVS